MIFEGQDENKDSSKSKSWKMKTKYKNSELEFCKIQVETKIYYENMKKTKQCCDASSYYKMVLNKLKVMRAFYLFIPI